MNRLTIRQCFRSSQFVYNDFLRAVGALYRLRFLNFGVGSANKKRLDRCPIEICGEGDSRSGKKKDLNRIHEDEWF